MSDIGLSYYRKLSGSAFKALIAVLVLIVIPFFYYPNETWACFRALFREPGWDISSFRPYYLLLWTGFNALSDMFSCLLVLSCIYCGITLPKRMYSIMLISFIFGFACLVRINNIFFAPLIAYLFYLKFKQELFNPTYIVKAFLTAMIFFLAVFGWQFLVNFLHFDSVLVWPYSLHSEASRGFELHTLLNGGMDFLLQTNLVYVTAGLLGMFFMADSVKRNIFVLWALPLIVFFCGYVCIFASPIRFILPAYGAFAGAFLCTDVIRNPNRKLLAFIIIVMLLNFLLVSPPFKHLNVGIAPERFHIMATLSVIVPVLSVIASVIMLRKEKKLLLFMTVFFLLYYSGSGIVLFALMLILLLITFLSVAKEVFSDFSCKTPPKK